MTFLNHWLLTILLLVPTAGALAALIVRRPDAVRWTAIGTAAGACLLSLLVPAIHARFSIATDGLSSPFVVLTTFVCLAACVVSWRVEYRPALYFSLILFFEATILGAFVAFDCLLLCLFLLLSIAPACLMVRIWGSARRRHAARRLLVYLLVSLTCLVVSVIGLHVASRQVFPGGSLDLLQLASPAMREALATPHLASAARVLFALAIVGFMIRLASVPLHAWLPQTIAEAPPPVGMVVGALIPATGGYGILRFALPLFPAPSRSLWAVLATLGAISILYGALCAIPQHNPRRLLAYGSVSLLGFALLGAAISTPTGANAAVFLLISHGLMLGLMLLVVDRHGADLPARNTLAAIARLVYLVVPGLIAQLAVLLAVFQSGQPNSTTTGSVPTMRGWALGLSLAGGLGIVLTAVYVSQALRPLIGSDPQPQPQPPLQSQNISAKSEIATAENPTATLRPTATPGQVGRARSPRPA